MAHFCNPEKEGREVAPSGFGAPAKTSVASHGVLYSGWQPNPERSVVSAPWFRVECCPRWPAHNESYINALCGHRIHEGCLLTLHEPYKMEACPICSGHTTHHDREGWFLRILFVFVSVGFWVPTLHLEHVTSVKMFMSVPFFLQNAE